MVDDPRKSSIVDAHGRPARTVIDARCPRCQVDCPKGDATKRVRSGGFGPHVHDVCIRCGYEFEELTV